ncbi:low temperature requirement protein A [Phytohabitans flavus]|uniref:low temperature requirement protein A n=1 Tax=Phytohabitans flavus TaxID=1076124 RepID=UPI00363C38FF
MKASDASRTAPKIVIWEELFFDLTFVFALTQFSHLLHDEHGGWGIVRTLILFIPVYWAWGGVTLYANQRDLKSLVDRLGVLVLGLGSLLMALTIPHAYEDLGLLFVVVYLAARALLSFLALRGLPDWRSVFIGPYGVFLVTGPLLLTGALLHGTARIAFWAAAAATDLLSPWAGRYLVAPRRAQPLHYTHRYGLLIILVLGESMIQTGMVAAGGTLTPLRLTAIAAAYAVAAALWWTYFRYGLPEIRRALEVAPDQPDLRRAVLIYSHLLFSFGIVTTSVGLADAVLEPAGALTGDQAVLLFGGSALFLFTFAYTRWRMFREIAGICLGGGVVCFALVPLATLIPAVTAVAALLVVIGVTIARRL